MTSPRTCVTVPPKEDEASNLEVLFLGPVTQPKQARDGADKVKKPTTDHETEDGVLVPIY